MTVAHINATAKNAADDKLRQSLRRFADTHTAPATVVLVSSKCLWYSSTVQNSIPLFDNTFAYDTVLLSKGYV